MNWAREYGAEHFTRLVAGDTSVCLIALADRAAVGYLAGTTYGPDDYRPVLSAELESMFVQAPWRSRLVGARLVQEFVAWAEARGARRMIVTAYAANQRAIAFYQKAGFAPHSLNLERALG